MENEDGILYKLWLNILCGHNPQTIFKCLRDFGTAQEIYESNEKYKRVKCSMRLSQRLKARHSLDEARDILEFCIQNDIDIITIDDERYPKRLAEVYMPPRTAERCPQDKRRLPFLRAELILFIQSQTPIYIMRL